MALPGTGLRIPDSGIDLYEVEKQLIQQALIRAGGNQSKAARLLSITRDTLRYKMKKYGLRKGFGQPEHTATG
jgi:DNA-binding NtrC family response regulator